jgi:hypothetical protein
MQDYLTDEELDSMFDEEVIYNDEPPPQAVERALAMRAPEPVAVPLYPLQMARPAPAQDPDQGLLRRTYGGVPGWAWGLMGLSVLGGGYMYYRSRNLQANGEAGSGGSEPETPALGDVVPMAANALGSGQGWSPSRSGFASALERYFGKKGMGAHVKVWVDADDAKKAGMKFVSPLLNIEVKTGGIKLDEALQKVCRREGLNAIQHQDGSIGLYPHTGKRGKAWEEYIDALRDDGQQV